LKIYYKNNDSLDVENPSAITAKKLKRKTANQDEAIDEGQRKIKKLKHKISNIKIDIDGINARMDESVIQGVRRGEFL
jgi:hypothetical protein